MSCSPWIPCATGSVAVRKAVSRSAGTDVSVIPTPRSSSPRNLPTGSDSFGPEAQQYGGFDVTELHTRRNRLKSR
ncbi:hypothetical protein GCM10009742_69910 [Kribbella karoonensis]|uniref:Uncharacterized protein n=1 Tax=Kribbella karoonensis TaxID=324851 RepID=A0ABN2EKK8_9ACTN